jgi:hypothetical protein
LTGIVCTPPGRVCVVDGADPRMQLVEHRSLVSTQAPVAAMLAERIASANVQITMVD